MTLLIIHFHFFTSKLYLAGHLKLLFDADDGKNSIFLWIPLGMVRLIDFPLGLTN